MGEEVIYSYVRGQGWVPRLESDARLLDWVEYEMSEIVFRYLSTAPIVPYTDDRIDVLEYAIRYTLANQIQVNSAAWLSAIV